jgi:hypothetical protein
MRGPEARVERIAVYTAITAARDTLKEPLCTPAGVDFVFFSDGSVPCRAPWREVRLPASPLSPRRLSRWPKLLSHEALPDFEYALWLDGSWTLCGDPRELLSLVQGEHAMALHRHPLRSCAYDEARICIEKGKDAREAIERQMLRYRRRGLPPSGGLSQASTILRRHTRDQRRFNAAWWRAYLRGSERDQLALAFTAWKLGARFEPLPGSPHDTPWYWGTHRHRP